jgi:hypothetical protein
MIASASGCFGLLLGSGCWFWLLVLAAGSGWFWLVLGSGCLLLACSAWFWLLLRLLLAVFLAACCWVVLPGSGCFCDCVWLLLLAASGFRLGLNSGWFWLFLAASGMLLACF